MKRKPGERKKYIKYIIRKNWIVMEERPRETVFLAAHKDREIVMNKSKRIQ